MLIGNNKNKIGDPDPFNKRKLAEEARRDQARIKADQVDQSKRRIQLQVDNLTRELSRLISDLRLKENQLLDLKRKADSLKRGTALTQGQMEQTEHLVKTLSSEVEAEENIAEATQSKLQAAKAKAVGKVKEVADFEFKYNNDRARLAELEKKINWLKYELANLVAEEKGVERVVVEDEKEIRNKKEEMKRVEQERQALESNLGTGQKKEANVVREVDSKKREAERVRQEVVLNKRNFEQLEREAEAMVREIAKLNQDKQNKEKQIDSLKRERDNLR